MSDTIAAIATPPGRGGVGIVRVSGNKSRDICQALLGRVPTERNATYAVFKDSQQNTIDQGLSLFFAQPKSFTGEDVLELQVHGGPVILDMLLRRVIELGARMARPGEFSERAFINNKIDLVQAEAVAQLINASSEQAVRAAQRSLQGEFSKAISALTESLIRLRMYVEAAIDFPEEEINFLADAHVQNTLQEINTSLNQVFEQAKQGALLSDGVDVVIVGRPNAGKSTLLNRLTGEDTAIVTPIAGTTRDTIKAQINLDGVMLNVIDTAGLRITDDLVEQHGIQRTWQAVQKSDLILLVIDAAQEKTNNPWVLHPDLKSMLNGAQQLLVVYNKIDQAGLEAGVEKHTGYSVVNISADQKLGLDLLREEIKQILGVSGGDGGDVFLARRRHLDALQRAQQHVMVGKQQLEQHAAGELLAEELKHAQLALSEITGEFSADDLLGRIFSEFCIGK